MSPIAAKRFGIISTIAAVLLLAWGLYSTPPSISIPSAIQAQWDSIWLANFPRPCSENSPLCLPKEFLGCVKIERRWLGWRVARWMPAANMIGLPAAASGNCFPPYNAMWHTHPARLLPSGCVSMMCANQMVDTSMKFKLFNTLSGRDLITLWQTGAKASLVTWAPKHTTAAIIWHSKLIYPAIVE